MSEWVPWIAWSNAMVDVAIGMAVIILACLRRPRLSAGWLLVTGFMALSFSWLSLIMKGSLLAALYHSPLAAIYLALVWIGLAPVMICGLTWLLFRHNATRAGRRLLLSCGALSILATATTLYASLIEPYWLVVEEVQIPLANVPPDMQPIRIAVLADIQTDVYGPYEKRWLRTLNELQVDMILLPGDFFDCDAPVFDQRYEHFVELLRQCDAPYGVYACHGNIDSLKKLRRMMETTNVKLLANTFDVVEIHGAKIAIGATVYDPGVRANPPYMHRMSEVPADATLFMSHVPDAALGAVRADNIDLIISGHTHGGQVQIPGFGPLMINSEVPHFVGAGGLHTLGEQRLYVSRGVGHERRGAPPLRFWCRPELTILELTPDKSVQNKLVKN